MNSILPREGALALSLLAAGCALRPVPEDYAGVATEDIVRQVRCEARSELADNIRQWLAGTGQQGLALQFPTDPRMDIIFNPARFPPPYRPIVEKFAKSGIAYDFTFDMAETDNFDATLDILGILRHTTGTAGLGGGIDRSRENIRNFTITDTFSGLLNLPRPSVYCRPYASVGNIIYPITGKIGLGNLIHNFIDLSLFSNLDGVSHKGPPAVGDTLTFTTKLTGSLNPRITLGQAHRGLQIADASLNATTSRSDQHKLIIGLALPDQTKSQAGKTTLQGAATTTTFFINAAPATPSEASAAQKIDQIIFRFELGRAAALSLITP